MQQDHLEQKPAQKHATRFIQSQAMLFIVIGLLCAALITAGVHGHYRKKPITIQATSCPSVLVTFADDAAMTSIHLLLMQVNATLVAGPNAHGAFVLEPVAGSAQELVARLNDKPDMVVIASLQDACD